MKQTYERVEIEIIGFDAEDIIVTSGGSGDPGIDEGEDEI